MLRMMLIAIVAATVGFDDIAHGQATAVPNFAVKAGETIDIGPIYWVNAQTCQSLSTAPSSVEMLEGPAGLKFEVKEGMVVPNAQNCKNQIKGGHIMMSVPEDIEATSAHVILRLIHHDRNGVQQRAFPFNILVAHGSATSVPTHSLVNKLRVAQLTCGMAPLPPLGCRVGACVCDRSPQGGATNCHWTFNCGR